MGWGIVGGGALGEVVGADELAEVVDAVEPAVVLDVDVDVVVVVVGGWHAGAPLAGAVDAPLRRTLAANAEMTPIEAMTRRMDSLLAKLCW